MDGVVRQQSFQKVLSLILSEPTRGQRTLRTLLGILNQLEKPSYRILSCDNPKVKAKLLNVNGVIDFLELAGFRYQVNGGGSGQYVFQGNWKSFDVKVYEAKEYLQARLSSDTSTGSGGEKKKE